MQAEVILELKQSLNSNEILMSARRGLSKVLLSSGTSIRILYARLLSRY